VLNAAVLTFELNHAEVALPAAAGAIVRSSLTMVGAVVPFRVQPVPLPPKPVTEETDAVVNVLAPSSTNASAP
jgi:hypothetical protein